MMEIELISFGKISDFIKNQTIVLTDISNTDELKAFLETSFPALANIKYKFALNNDLVQENSNISNHDTVAIMPPFSGG